jgi:hypothetical protein
MNKKIFFVFIATLTVLMGCNSTTKKQPATSFTWTSMQNPHNDQGEKQVVAKERSSEKEVTAKADASTETTAPTPTSTPVAEVKQPEPVKPAPAPAPAQAKSEAPASAPAPEPVTRSIPVGPYGTPGVILRNVETVTYRPAYAVYNAGFMFRMQNDSNKFYWVAPAGDISMRPLVGQCMESPRLPPVPNPEACPFVELKTNTGSWVVLIKPGYSARFVIDAATCPPDGSACKARIQSVPYSMSAVTRPDLSRRWVREFSYPASRTGHWWARGN